MSSAPRLVACTMRPACSRPRRCSSADGVRERARRSRRCVARRASIALDAPALTNSAACDARRCAARTAAAARARRPGSGRGRSASARSRRLAATGRRAARTASKPVRCSSGSMSTSTSPVARISPREAIARAQQAGLAVGAAVGPLREVQRDQRAGAAGRRRASSTSTSFGTSTPTGRSRGHWRARRATARASAAGAAPA